MKRTYTEKQFKGLISRASGASFEDIISSVCNTYSTNKIAKIEKQQEPVKMIKPMNRLGQFLACFTQRAGVDYKGTIMGGKSVAFEAKHTDTDRMLKTRLQPWQHEYLEEHKNLGAITFILISFKMQNFYRIPLDVWDNMKEIYGRQYLTEKDIAEYKIKDKGFFVDFLAGFYDENALPQLLR